MHDFPEPNTTPSSSGMTRWLAIGGGIFVLLCIIFVVLTVIYPGFREVVRDLSIILLALFQLIGAIAMALVAVAILYAVKAIDTTARVSLIPKLEEISTKVDDILVFYILFKKSSFTDDLKNTTASVSTAAEIISQEVVKPAIQISSLFSGVKAAATVLGQRVTDGLFSKTPGTTKTNDDDDAV
jgi:hypothetical protein